MQGPADVFRGAFFMPREARHQRAAGGASFPKTHSLCARAAPSLSPGGKRLREVKDEDYCFLTEMRAMEGEMLADILRGNGIECVSMPSGSGLNTAMALPLENSRLYVPWRSLEQAKAYENQGADERVFLDITASSDNRAIMRDVVERTAGECFMPLTVGGGLRTLHLQNVGVFLADDAAFF